MSVSFINGHIDGSDRCAICGRDIPEGRQYCVICGKVGKGKQTNYDRIRNMSVEELAEFLENTNSNCAIKLGDGYIVRDKLYIRIWLEAEVTE